MFNNNPQLSEESPEKSDLRESFKILQHLSEVSLIKIFFIHLFSQQLPHILVSRFFRSTQFCSILQQLQNSRPLNINILINFSSAASPKHRYRWEKNSTFNNKNNILSEIVYGAGVLLCVCAASRQNARAWHSKNQLLEDKTWQVPTKH